MTLWKKRKEERKPENKQKGREEMSQKRRREKKIKRKNEERKENGKEEGTGGRERENKERNREEEEGMIKWQDHQDPSTPHTGTGNQPEGGGHPDSAIGQWDHCQRIPHEADGDHGTHDHPESVITLGRN